MNRYQSHGFAVASLSLGLLTAASTRAAALTEVTRSTWAGSVTLPSYVSMYIYVPDKVATKPPILVSAHACQSGVDGQMSNNAKIKAAADANGFILILPHNQGRNCWDVGAASSLGHDKGGDTHAVAVMVKYALTKYNGDPTRVYAMGGSSGGMLTQALMAVYPDVFKAGAARAGVPAGCWADSYKPADQWSDTCAGGNVTKTAEAWGKLVRDMYPGYTGHRPRLQLIQGMADPTINYKNMAESIKEWTNVLGLSETPTSSDKAFKGQVASYDRQFWKNACGYTVLEAWSSPGGTHSMGYEEDAILKFFGLDKAGGSDPEDEACPDGSVGGTGGASATGGASSSGGATTAGGTNGKGGGSSTVPAGSGGRVGGGGSGASISTGGSSSNSSVGGTGGSGGSIITSPKGGTTGTGGAVGSGGAAASSGGSAKGGTESSTTGTGGAVGSGGTTTTSESSAKGGSGLNGVGGTQGTGQATTKGGDTGTGVSTLPLDTAANGCSCVVRSHAGRSVPTMAALLLAFGLIARRKRQTRA